MKRSTLYISIFLYFLISLLIFNSSFSYIKKEEKRLLDEKFITISNHMKKSLDSLINDKKNATLAISMAIAKDPTIINALNINDSSKIDLKSFSKKLKEETLFKNVWFQILDKEGKSFYRSWTNHNNDSLIFRPDVKNILKEKKILASISVGRYDMTFKSMIPIFYKEKLLGIFEVITHFNSISKVLEKDKVYSIILADKQYKKKLTHPFSKKFIDDYYIANLNVKNDLITFIKENNLEEILKINNYKLIKNHIITTKNIQFDNKPIGYVILIKHLSDINKHDIDIFKRTYITYLIIFLILFGLLFIMFLYYGYSRKIEKLNHKLKINLKKIKLQERKKQTILDSQKNIIVITDGKILQNANIQLLKFFDNFPSIKEFKKEYECICETFVEIKNDSTYLIDTDYDGNNWAEHILVNPNKKFKAAIYKNNLLHHFALNVSQSKFEDEKKPFIIVTLTDITYEMRQNKKIKTLNENLENIVKKKTKQLQELNETLEQKIELEINKSKEKDRILFQQTKMAAMGEMLENIAHQWRQPLNSISTSASTLKLHKELDLLDNNQIDTSCDFILKNSYYLSQTIEDFKNFFKRDKNKQYFKLEDSILENINLLKDKLKHNQIEIILKIDKNIKIYGYKNEFQQAILNILNNSIDVFLIKKIETRKIIIIEYEDKHLNIKDSANGVEDKILEKIFEPYFTTKHQSQGTGIGLYMTEQILTKHMNCTIEAKNSDFKFENNLYKGLSFQITFK